MPEEYGRGGGALFDYDAEELEEGLAKHQHLTKDLPSDGYVFLVKSGADIYSADVQAPDGADQRFFCQTLPPLLERVKAFLAEHSEPEDVGTAEGV